MGFSATSVAADALSFASFRANFLSLFAILAADMSSAGIVVVCPIDDG
jgi:hypothetical protein